MTYSCHARCGPSAPLPHFSPGPSRRIAAGENLFRGLPNRFRFRPPATVAGQCLAAARGMSRQRPRGAVDGDARSGSSRSSSTPRRAWRNDWRNGQASVGVGSPRPAVAGRDPSGAGGSRRATSLARDIANRVRVTAQPKRMPIGRRSGCQLAVERPGFDTTPSRMRRPCQSGVSPRPCPQYEQVVMVSRSCGRSRGRTVKKGPEAPQASDPLLAIILSRRGAKWRNLIKTCRKRRKLRNVALPLRVFVDR